MFNKDLIFIINGQEVSHEAVKDWEYKRLAANYKMFSKFKNVHINPLYKDWLANKDIDKLNQELVRVKMKLGFDELTKLLKPRFTLGNAMSSIAVKLANGKRKFSVTEIYVPHTDKTAQEVMDKIYDIMMVKTPKHDAMNVATNPDHYVLQSLEDEVQEVIETTGGSPLPTRFFAHYYEETGLQSKMSPDYDIELPGVAKYEDGTIIGGMRHQIKQEKDGIKYKALVEFPALLPESMIKQHQYHLACEFGHWISDALNEK